MIRHTLVIYKQVARYVLSLEKCPIQITKLFEAKWLLACVAGYINTLRCYVSLFECFVCHAFEYKRALVRANEDCEPVESRLGRTGESKLPRTFWDQKW